MAVRVPRKPQGKPVPVFVAAPVEIRVDPLFARTMVNCSRLVWIDRLEAVSDTDAEDPRVKIDICVDCAAVDFHIGVQENFLHIDVGRPVAADGDIQAGLQC